MAVEEIENLLIRGSESFRSVKVFHFAIVLGGPARLRRGARAHEKIHHLEVGNHYPNRTLFQRCQWH